MDINNFVLGMVDEGNSTAHEIEEFMDSIENAPEEAYFTEQDIETGLSTLVEEFYDLILGIIPEIESLSFREQYLLYTETLRISDLIYSQVRYSTYPAEVFKIGVEEVLYYIDEVLNLTEKED